MKVYLVGGAVRDEMLGLPVQDRDWVVVGGTREQMLTQGYVQPDKDFPVFRHPQTNEEYALARRELKTGTGYKGFSFNVDRDVSLEEDLQRRDLTINAMAKDEQGNIIDPYDGQGDLRECWLRHVGPQFSEDPLRLLRLCRFNCKLGHLGFRPTHQTWAMMKKMATGELLTLSTARQWKEMSRALTEPEPWRYFMLLKGCGALAQIQPGLDRLLAQVSGHSAQVETEWVTLMRLAVKEHLSGSAILVTALATTAITEAECAMLAKDLGADRKFSQLLEKVIFVREQQDILVNGPGDSLLVLLEHLGFQKNAPLLASILEVWAIISPQQFPVIRRRIDLMEQVFRQQTAAPLLQQGVRGKDVGTQLTAQRVELFNQLVSKLDE